MIIRKAEYIISAVKCSQYPPPVVPEIAVAGRSNVGKSSLINKFLSRRNLAKTGQTPGKTQTINFFTINDQWYLVDLPGYGYAKVPQTTKARWRHMMEEYFARRKTLRGVILLVDIRHKPTEDDRIMMDMLRTYGYPVLVVATKADKIARSERPKYLREIGAVLDIDSDVIVSFSVKDQTGFEELHEAVGQLVGS
ncbi:MAG: ribosome biogenesis GTP-binding protein YihA/YsxC [Gracilibacteraceae bacterium]|jgi:GTP-binding protein|nr:ribosome biogenesis GTP-binding protein YihA/YsxC [Gracilibacteraceae bacterium]